jgi:hypothetical protein
MARLIGVRESIAATGASGVWPLSKQSSEKRAGFWPLSHAVMRSAGAQGFGVGIYPHVLPSGITGLSGYNDITNANYGNYQTTNGSLMVFIPRFYYRIGSASSPRYAAHGANAIDIVGAETYDTEAQANSAGYAMHRAFKDGGNDKSGFFIDKYLASKDGTTTCKSIANADPISLTDNTDYTPSNGMTDCAGISADAVVLSRARGTGFHCASVFQYSALALLSLAHGQASSSTTYCAWYDAAHNFPKGCNNNELADVNDVAITYANSTPGVNTKPKTRATAYFTRTTHNGQESGVADLNGSLAGMALGITNYGTSDTDTASYTNGNGYALKPSVAIGDLTAGWDSGNAAWGNTTHLATLYDSVSNLFPWTTETDYYYLGNGTNQVFSAATSGTNWLRTCAGLPKDMDAFSAQGTALFGKDSLFLSNKANLFVRFNGFWGGLENAGVFCSFYNIGRASKGLTLGFRCGLYGA